VDSRRNLDGTIRDRCGSERKREDDCRVGKEGTLMAVEKGRRQAKKRVN
jgi:hypothetical protein